jgi:flagellar motility protein MotE (MotC chaperone)
MMTRILNPLILAVIALVGGVVAGPLWYWTRADALVAAAVARRHAAVAKQAEQAKSWDFWTIAIDNLTSELKDEKERLRLRSEQLDQREARLDAERQDLDKVRADIEAMRAQIDARVIAINADEAKNLRTLAQTYTNLTAPAAVAILKDLDDTTVVKILSLMKPDAVGLIFEEMARPDNPDPTLARRAAVISDKMRLMKAAGAADSTAAN